MRVFAGQERLKAPGEAPSRYRSSTTDSIVFIIFTIAAIELKLFFFNNEFFNNPHRTSILNSTWVLRAVVAAYRSFRDLRSLLFVLA